MSREADIEAELSYIDPDVHVEERARETARS
jgi:hypothetical protein